MNTKVNITETGMKIIQELAELRKAFYAIGQHEHKMPQEAYNGMVNGFHQAFRGLESEIIEEIFNANSWEPYRTLHPLLPQSGLASEMDTERKAETPQSSKGH
tara:strand:+ start:2569 stop:2877 length:309 start_codon:yes stop_codon:yes gene_type:complete